MSRENVANIFRQDELRRLVTNKPSVLHKLSAINQENGMFSPEQWVSKLAPILESEIPRELTVMRPQHTTGIPIIIQRKWLVEFALRLSSRPETLKTWAGRRYEMGLEKMLAFPMVVRAARYVVLIAGNRRSRTFRNRSISWDWE